MRHEEVNIQTLIGSEDVHIGYSDENIVVIDSIQKFVEIGAAHVSMEAIIICVSGKAQALMSGKPFTLTRNQIAVLPPSTLVSDLMISPDFDMKAMFLKSGIIQSFLREKMNVWNEMMYIHGLRIIDIKEEQLVFFKRFYEMLQLCFDLSDDIPYRGEVIQSLLRAAVLALCGAMKQIAPVAEERPSSTSLVGNTYFQRFLDLLHSGSRKHRTVESYASELCITPKYLTSLCKKQSGKTANQWITEQLLEDIRYYLRQTDLSVKQICDQLGFPNPSFFGKYVKEHFGMTPVQFRNALS